MKIPGFIPDDRLTFEDHLKSLTRKASIYLRIIHCYSLDKQADPSLNILSTTSHCYEMDKTSISMFEILEPGGRGGGGGVGGSALGQYVIIGVLIP